MPVRRDPMRSQNPRWIAALIMVDVSPRWIAGCTIVEPRQNLDMDSYEMARVAERIGCLARHVEELDVPIMAVESGTLDRLDVSDLRGKWIALCGLYGGASRVRASLSAGFAQHGYESFRNAMPSSGRLVKNRLAL